MPEAALATAMPLGCETVGVLGPVASLIASWQANEALKIMVGATDRTSPDLIHVELWSNEATRFSARRTDRCEVCVRRRFPLLERRERMMTTSLCGHAAVQVVPPASLKLDFELLRDTLRRTVPLEDNGHLLKFSADGHPMVVFPDGRAMVFNTADAKQALRLYAKYVGA
jgi:adenylyltransferase/sulfurtransferase